MLIEAKQVISHELPWFILDILKLRRSSVKARERWAQLKPLTLFAGNLTKQSLQIQVYTYNIMLLAGNEKTI